MTLTPGGAGQAHSHRNSQISATPKVGQSPGDSWPGESQKAPGKTHKRSASKLTQDCFVDSPEPQRPRQLEHRPPSVRQLSSGFVTKEIDKKTVDFSSHVPTKKAVLPQGFDLSKCLRKLIRQALQGRAEYQNKAATREVIKQLIVRGGPTKVKLLLNHTTKKVLWPKIKAEIASRGWEEDDDVHRQVKQEIRNFQKSIVLMTKEVLSALSKEQAVKKQNCVSARSNGTDAKGRKTFSPKDVNDKATHPEIVDLTQGDDGPRELDDSDEDVLIVAAQGEPIEENYNIDQAIASIRIPGSWDNQSGDNMAQILANYLKIKIKITNLRADGMQSVNTIGNEYSDRSVIELRRQELGMHYLVKVDGQWYSPPADGDCFFRSIQFARTGRADDASVRNLRNELADHMERSKTAYQEFFTYDN